MVIILLFLLFRGLTYLISESQIFENIRFKIKNKNLSDLVSCPTCTSFWVALITTFILTFNIYYSVILAISNIGLMTFFRKKI
jgi:hypothetical protein